MENMKDLCTRNTSHNRTWLLAFFSLSSNIGGLSMVNRRKRGNVYR
jgi:hypothetical protein